MATISIGLNSTPITGQKNYTLSDANVTRMIDALKTFYNIPTATNAQVLARWGDDVIDALKRMVKDQEAKASLPADLDIT